MTSRQSPFDPFIIKATVAALLHLPSGLFAFPIPPDTTVTQEVKPRVIHKKIEQHQGAWVINVLEIDLTRPDLEIESARGLDRSFGRETVTSIAKRKGDSLRHVTAAINADFFDLKTGEVENNQVINEEFVKGVKITGSPHDVFDNVHSQFAVSVNRRPYLDRFRFSGTAILKGGTKVEISTVNVRPDTNAAAIFNRYFGKTTPRDSVASQIAEIVLQRLQSRQDTLIFLVKTIVAASGSAIPDDGAVLSLRGRSHQLLRMLPLPGDTVKIFLGFQPYCGPIKTLVGGWPRLVLNGKNIARLADSLEGTFPRFSANRHPRSGVGFSKDSTRIFFITVDGRQQSSVGMSLVEFGDLMVSLGIYQGLNLDGGGSTTFVINGKVVNSPSDAQGERPVGNCLLLVTGHRQ